MKKRADVTVDFTGIESGGRAVADGNYVLEVISIEEKESSEGNPYLAWKWKVTDDGPYKGGKCEEWPRNGLSRAVACEKSVIAHQPCRDNGML